MKCSSAVNTLLLGVLATACSWTFASTATPSPGTPKPMSIEGAPSRGNADARLVVIEFSDFQCPYCGKHARETFAELEEGYIATGKVRYVFRHFPLDQSHPSAFKAAVAAECAADQGKFWEMHALLFANQHALAGTDLASYAKTLALDGDAFQRCLGGPAKGKVRRDFNDGLKAGVSGTPTFFIGTVQKDGKVNVLKTLSGIQTIATFKAALDALLASAEAASPAR
jgi:protein-disulfide isomerase